VPEKKLLSLIKETDELIAIFVSMVNGVKSKKR